MAIEIVISSTLPHTWAEMANTNFVTADSVDDGASQYQTDWTIVTRGKRKGALLRSFLPARRDPKEARRCAVLKQHQTVIVRPAKTHNYPIKENYMAAQPISPK